MRQTPLCTKICYKSRKEAKLKLKQLLRRKGKDGALMSVYWCTEHLAFHFGHTPGQGTKPPERS